MAKFYLDHNVARNAAPLLRSRGHTAFAAYELGAARLTDDALLLMAAESASILITHNRMDFELLHDAWIRWTRAWNVAHEHSGIMIFQQPLDARDLAALVAERLRDVGSVAGQLHDWRLSRGWRQKLEPPPPNRRIREESGAWVLTELT